MNQQLFQQASQHHQAGQFAQAEQLYRQLLMAQPDHVEGYHLLGVVCGQQGKHFEAVSHLQQAIALDNQNPLYHHNLGEVWRLQGQLEQARACYQQALALNPTFAQARQSLEKLLSPRGQQRESSPTAPQTPPKRRGDEAYIASLFAQGNNHHDLGELEPAARYFERVLRLNPDHPGANHELGVLYLTTKQWPKAEHFFREAIRLNPQSINSYANLGMALTEQGKFEEARQSYQPVLQKEPHNVALHLHVAALNNPMPMSNAEIDAYRQRMEQTLDYFTAHPITGTFGLMALQTANAYPPYSWHYHGRPQRSLREKWAAIFRPRLPHIPLNPPQSGKPRLGFVVTSGHENIFIKTLMGAINQLEADRFHVTVIGNHTGAERLQKSITNSEITLLTCPARLDEMARLIAEARLDFLGHSEIGSDSLNYFLPMLRLAPVQALFGSTMGCTSGIQEVDYYLSSAWLETAEGDEHYSETLVRFQQMDPNYKRPNVPVTLHPRDYFGFKAHDHVYLCAQNLLKIHPDFDALVAEILQRDPQGVVAFISNDDYVMARLQERLGLIMPTMLDRVRVLPYMKTPPDYFSLLAAANVALDTPHFGGSNMTYDTFAVGTPIVTLPNQFMRSRRTMAIYQRMGVTGPVAESNAEYVDMTVDLAIHADQRAALSERIKEGFEKLFTAQDAVSELSDFIEQAVRSARQQGS